MKNDLSVVMRKVVGDVEGHPSLQRLLRLATRTAGGTGALVSFMDGEDSLQLLGHGIPLAARGWLQLAVQLAEPGRSQVEDATLDPRLRLLPIVTEEPFVRMAAGFPLVRKSGSTIGALCVVGPKATALDQATREAIDDIAALLIDELEVRRGAQLSSEKAAEEQERAQQISEVLEASPLGIIAVDSAGRLQTWNAGAQQILGWLASEVLGNTLPPIVPPDLRREWLELQAAGMRGETRRLTTRRQHRDGREIVVDLALAPMRASDGTIRGRVAVFADVTEREEARRNLAESELRYRLLLEQAGDGIIISEDGGAILEANDRICELLGRDRESLVGTDVALLDARAPDKPSTQRTVVRDVIFGRLVGQPVHDERSLRCADGSVRVLDVTTKVLPDGHAIGIYRDLSERRRAEEALRLSESKFRRLIESAPDAVLVQRDGRILYANQALVQLQGFSSADALIGHSVLELVHPDDRSTARELGAGSEPPQRFHRHRELRHLRRDGVAVSVEVSTVPVEYEGGAATVAFIRDVSARKELERRLLVTERMASVGTLAAGVAHEINNPLAYVLTNLEFALGELGSQLSVGSPRMTEALLALEEARRGAERVQQIVQSLKTFSHPEEDRRRPVDVRRTLDLAIRMATSEIKQRAQLRRHYGDVPAIEANESRLGQVFLNLLVNAAQAIPDGHVGEHEITVKTATDAQGRAVIEVTDTGPGIAPEVIGRIFDPFFTTKPVGVGTGLGLSICHNIVRSLGGEIAVESRVGVGTTLRVTLPPAGAERAKVHTTNLPAPAALRRARVLVIDDEPAIGASIRRVLSAHHDVEVVTGGRDGVAKLTGDVSYDVVLCDLMMPDLTGMDVWEELSQKRPDILPRIVFLTGGTFTERARIFVEERPDKVVTKPFRPQELRQRVAAILSEIDGATAS